jgi:hypothetical protein
MNTKRNTLKNRNEETLTLVFLLSVGLISLGAAYLALAKAEEMPPLYAFAFLWGLAALICYTRALGSAWRAYALTRRLKRGRLARLRYADTLNDDAKRLPLQAEASKGN